jgi:hypothetical protein
MNLKKLKIYIYLILSQKFKETDLIETDELIYEGNVALDTSLAEQWADQIINHIKELNMACKGKKKGGKKK